MSHFWDVSAADVVRWLLLVGGFAAMIYAQTKLLTQRMNGFEQWMKNHEEESRSRDELIVELKVANERLAVLAAAAERRLERLEDRR
jgi:hypothetical protein